MAWAAVVLALGILIGALLLLSMERVLTWAPWLILGFLLIAAVSLALIEKGKARRS
jgi:hypothetical protein